MQVVRNYAVAGYARTRVGTGSRGVRTEVALEDVVARRTATGGAPGAEREPAGVIAPPGSVVAPPGSMVAPTAQRESVPGQLGDLHQVGQDLAEARERAAKAETENAFLRERMAEMRAAAETPEPHPAGPETAPTATPGRAPRRRWWQRTTAR